MKLHREVTCAHLLRNRPALRTPFPYPPLAPTKRTNNMRTSLFTLPAMLLAPALAAQQPQQNHVYVLGASQSNRATLGQALSKLGYSPSSSASSSQHARRATPGQESDNSFIYTDLPASDFASLSETNPDAKYIILSSKPSSPQLVISDDRSDDSWRGMNETMGAGAGAEGRFLELRLGAHDAPRTQAEAWVELCDFLGLGYSVVERLKLWQFP